MGVVVDTSDRFDESIRRAVKETATSGELLTLAEAKSELGVVDTGDATLDLDTDTQLNALIVEVREMLERSVCRTFRTDVTRELTLDRWPKKEIKIDDPPLLSSPALTVQYWDEDNAPQTLASTEYDVLNPDKGRGRVVFNGNFTRPSLYGRADAILVTYHSGYAAFPGLAKRAAKILLTAHWDDDKDDKSLEMYSVAAKALIIDLEWGEYA